MAYGNNRAGTQPRAHFQQAGGSLIKFRHPFLIGQVDTNGNIDEIDISACLKLEGVFFCFEGLHCIKCLQVFCRFYSLFKVFH